MARHRYDHQWKEVQDINGYVVLVVYVVLAIRGIGFLVVTWTTVVLLGGFVSMLDKHDFGRLTLITLVQILWINASFTERMMSASSMDSSSKTVKNLLMRKWQLADKARGDHPKLAVAKRVVAAMRAVLGWVLAQVHNVLLVFCRLSVSSLFVFGLLITTSYSIYGLVKQDYYSDTGVTNIYLAHNILFIMCLAQGALFLYGIILVRWEKRIAKQVSQAYGFQDGNDAVSGYIAEIKKECFKKPSSAEERNLVTYAIELMESKSLSSYLSGTLILDRLLTRQHSDKINAPTFIDQEEEKQQHKLDFDDKTGVNLIEKRRKKKHQQTDEEIIMQQRRVIKRLVGSASSAHILQKLLDTLESKYSDDKRMREAAARIVELVSSRIHLNQFPRGIQCISSLINSFEEYRRLQPNQSSSLSINETTTTSPLLSDTKNGHDQEQGSYTVSSSESESEYPESDSDGNVNQSSSKALHGYKDVVLTGLHILWGLAGDDDNCRIISNTDNLVSKIMAPTSCDLVHRAGHSPWSTMVSERSLGVMLRLIVTAKGDTRAELRKQISSDEGAITNMEKIVTCDRCKGGELQMKAMQILTQLCMDKTENVGNLTKVLISIFVNGDNSDGFIRKTAGKTLVMLFLSTKGVALASLLPKKENDKFVGDLAKILLQVGDNGTCRRGAAEILEHLCIQYTENEQYLSTLENTMKHLMPKVLREILSGSIGEEGNPRYVRSGTDVESQVTTNNAKNNNNHNSLQNKHHTLYVPLLSLYVTACEQLHLDPAALSPGEGVDQATHKREYIAFRLAIKMVQLSKNLFTINSLTAMKLTTRMVIDAMKKKLSNHDTVVEQGDLEGLMNSLSCVSKTMLDLESCMVFATGITKTADTLDSLVKEAQELYGKIKVQDSGHRAS